MFILKFGISFGVILTVLIFSMYQETKQINVSLNLRMDAINQYINIRIDM